MKTIGYRVNNMNTQLSEVERMLLRSAKVPPYMVTRRWPGLRHVSPETLLSTSEDLVNRGFLKHMHGGFVLTNTGWNAVGGR